MSTSKHIDRICILAVIAALLISLLFINGAALGIQTVTRTMGYENRLFDTSKVHTIDILMDDWDGFLATATSEEYSVCSVVIDGETFKNVGIRGKGNTSLSKVASMDSDRYSFKIEFDQYDSTKSYYGLDKLSLNNLIQDNTMMKDYLTYQMMNEFGVASSLCSYAYITVNGEDWGLYLAVEAVEESFLERNYGSNYGHLYKPDSMSMGGGRGNGKDFTMEDIMDASEDGAFPEAGGLSVPVEPPSGQTGKTRQQGASGEDSTRQNRFSTAQMDGAQVDRNKGGGMGSSDTKLQYTDDQTSSYTAIFDNAKTDAAAADQQRLIASLKSLSEGTNLEDVLLVDAVIRYFVVHNYVVNADSYTGSMIHNYYLYEEDGQLSMIPWDYNLAYGTFQGGNADSMVNDDIDAPLSVTGSDRPMIDWIFDSEQYTELYHRYFQDFLDTVDVSSIIHQAAHLIAPFVEKDPTKFCTYEEFEKGVETLTTFCDLRSQSVALQLAGSEENVDASVIMLSDMGTMNSGSGGGGGENRSTPVNNSYRSAQKERTSGMPDKNFAGKNPQMPGRSDASDNAAAGEGSTYENQKIPAFNGRNGMDSAEQMESVRTEKRDNSGQKEMAVVQSGSRWAVLTAAAVILAAGLLIVIKYKR